MIVILPPSERKNNDSRSALVPLEDEKDSTVKSRDLLRPLELNGKQYVNWDTFLPAGERYNGVLWVELKKELSLGACSKIWVPNPLFGISNFYDPVPDYKLHLNLKFAQNSDQEKYDRFIDEQITEFFSSKKDEIILDLTTTEIRKFLFNNKRPKKQNVYSINYLSGPNKLLGHAGKKLKGEHARLILSGIDSDINFTVKDALKLNPAKNVFITID